MILLIPGNRICQGKQTRFPITGYNPVLWLKTENENYSVISIDGFIVNNQNTVNGIFKKLEYTEETPGEDISLNDIRTLVSGNELALIKQLADVLQCRFYIFIWPENYPEGYDKDQALIHSITLTLEDGELKFNTHRKVNLDTLEKGIRTMRGFTFRHVKNLNSASSNLECYLANHTTNPWPGDIDAMIYNLGTGRFEAIIEFKTHNMDAPVQNEWIGKYGDEDWRRFNVLFDLIDNFNNRLGYRPKLFFIVWGTNAANPNHANIKVDLIERGRVIRSVLFPRPPYNVFSNDLFNYLTGVINEV
ncbi:hypothetical protein ABID99_003547 [Mucilaginibacter sp. OAE612]|uniref:hypothetical protein n=1 Tax=Mucilaginibacter sp. OAE612 TaxID=3156444 RepID=UPI00359DDCFE